ncbi:hypothetical protein IGI37_001108 [Enterococcus sp. AZ194]|uniref:AraC family transcriptional regulator n=1 Tax=Enterococcus sp. AZ194 TaxID=2774629 RepID=UPI003F236B29
MNIKQISETNLIYKRRTGAYGVENKNLMEDFKKWLANKELLNDQSVILAITWDNPQTTKPEDCRYDVALVVEAFEETQQLMMNKAVLPSGKYAIFTIDHTENAIRETMQTMFSELASQGQSFDVQRPIIERYAVERIKVDQCEICVPLL